jgi:hypothetical protein
MSLEFRPVYIVLALPKSIHHIADQNLIPTFALVKPFLLHLERHPLVDTIICTLPQLLVVLEKPVLDVVEVGEVVEPAIAHLSLAIPVQLLLADLGYALEERCAAFGRTHEGCLALDTIAMQDAEDSTNPLSISTKLLAAVVLPRLLAPVVEDSKVLELVDEATLLDHVEEFGEGANDLWSLFAFVLVPVELHQGQVLSKKLVANSGIEGEVARESLSQLVLLAALAS